MMSNAPTQLFVAESSAVSVAEAPSRGFVAWFLAWFQQSLCALHGHDAILQYERNRIYLRCTSCGHETPGWEVPNNATVRHRPAIDARSPRPSRDLAVARKIA